jgi:hypothetical protein
LRRRGHSQQVPNSERKLAMRLLQMLLFSVGLLAAAPSLATPTIFEVTGYDLGRTVGITLDGASRTVATALFYERVDGVAGTSFCADLLQTISRGTYYDFVAIDPTAAESEGFAAAPPPREFAFAARIASAWSNDIDALAASLGVLKVDAITGVQVAIWEAVYGGAFSVTSMSDAAWKVYEYVSAADYSGYGDTLLYYSPTRQDQLFTPPVPEPSAMLAFGVGALLVGRSLLRRRQQA